MPSHLRIETGVPCSMLRGWKRRLTALGAAVLESESGGGYHVDVIAVDDVRLHGHGVNAFVCQARSKGVDVRL